MSKSHSVPVPEVFRNAHPSGNVKLEIRKPGKGKVELTKVCDPYSDVLRDLASAMGIDVQCSYEVIPPTEFLRGVSLGKAIGYAFKSRCLSRANLLQRQSFVWEREPITVDFYLPPPMIRPVFMVSFPEIDVATSGQQERVRKLAWPEFCLMHGILMPLKICAAVTGSNFVLRANYNGRIVPLLRTILDQIL